MYPEWVYSLRDQCQNNRVAFFFKQWGEWRPLPEMERVGKRAAGRLVDNQIWDEIPEPGAMVVAH
jgi:protein gp37